MTRKAIAIITIAALVFVLPFLAAADNQEVAPEQGLQEAVTLPAEWPPVEEPVAELPVEEVPVEEALTEEVLAEEVPEEEVPEEVSEEEHSEEEILVQAVQEGFEGIEPSGLEISIEELLQWLYDDLNEIRVRVQDAFDYIEENPGSFDGNEAYLEALIAEWEELWGFLDAIFSDWDGFILFLMDEYGLTEEEAVNLGLFILITERDGLVNLETGELVVDPDTGEIIYRGMEFYFLDQLREIGFDVVGYCDECGPDSPVGCPDCWCHECRGHGSPDCRFCNPQEGDGADLCLGCFELEADCVCPCGDCGDFPCSCPPPPVPCADCGYHPCRCTITPPINGGGVTPAPPTVPREAMVDVVPQTGDALSASTPLFGIMFSLFVLSAGLLARRRVK